MPRYARNRFGQPPRRSAALLAYIVRRLLLIIPTLFGIMLVNFVVIQAAPGGPVEQVVAQLRGHAVEATARVGGPTGGETGRPADSRSGGDDTSRYRGARGIDPELIKQLERQFGFDRPAHERFFKMLKSYVTFDFGRSFYRDRSVIELIVEKMPVSISLGLWTTLLINVISIPLGVAKAVRDGSRFDVWTSTVIIVGYVIPAFLFGMLLIVLFGGGSFLAWFPLRGLVSDHWADLAWPARIADYLWHITLPVTALVISGFAGLTMLTKNSFIDELSKQYVMTARAKGLVARRVLYGHVFRNAMLIPIAGFPGTFIGIFFAGSMLIEVIFSLDGLGLLGFEAAINRDYPIMFGTLYVFTLLGLVMRLVADLTYVAVDPRIDFARRQA